MELFKRSGHRLFYVQPIMFSEQEGKKRTSVFFN